MEEDKDYVCSLDEATLQKAKEELHEDPKNRLGAVETFRKWIYDQKYIKCPTDTLFLLSFLRARKFSQLEARRLLENYLSRRDKFASWFKGVDPADPKIHALLDDGCFLLGGKDREGRQVLIIRPGHMDVSFAKYEKIHIFQAMGCILTLMNMTNEDTQVHGSVTFVDLDKMTIKHQTKISMEERKNLMHTWQKNFPARLKAVHVYNTGPFLEFAMLLIRSAMSEKIQKRIVMHGQIMEGVYKHIPMSALPAEYLPDDYTGPRAATTQEIIENMKARLKSPEIRERMRYLADPKFGIDIKLKPDYVPEASFRQLKVD